jgi:ferredoxin-NADP reductase
MQGELVSMPEIKIALKERRHEYADVYTYVFEPPHSIPFIPGSYAHMRVFGLPPEEKSVREFSFASAPYESELWFGVDARSGSAFQTKLKSLRIGDTVALFKIKTHMTWPPPHASDAVMIAGGIGITPFRSMLRDLQHTPRPLTATLLHVGSGSFLYQSDLERLPAAYSTLGREDLHQRLSEVIAEHPLAHYYIAASPGFVRAVAGVLSDASITKVESDEFKGLIEENL